MLKPRDPAKSNGTVFFEVSNRGGKGMVTMFSFGSSSLDPQSDAEFGDKFLLEQGFTLVWLGWQFDVPDAPGRIRLYAPAIPNRRARQKRVRSGDRNRCVHAWRPQPSRLCGRRPSTATSQFVAGMMAHHAPYRGRSGSFRRGPVSMSAGFEPGNIYEVIYQAKDPAVVGLGPAASAT